MPDVVDSLQALRLQRDAAWLAHCTADSGADELVVELVSMAADGPGNSEAAEVARARYETKKVEADVALSLFVETTQEIERLLSAACR